MSGGGGDGGNGGGVGETDMGGYTDEQAAAVSAAIGAADASGPESMGVGGYSQAQSEAMADAAMAMDFGMDPMGVVGNVADPNDTLGLGLGTQQGTAMAFADPPDIGFLGRAALGLMGLSPKGFAVAPDTTAIGTIGIGMPGIASAVTNALGFNTSPISFTYDASYPGNPNEDHTFDVSIGSDNVQQPDILPPVAQPVAVVENVAAPIVVEDPMATPSLLMRPSTLNVAPANSPAAYSLLYPEQERRFQESFALRPEYYSGALDTTGYQPVASLLI